MEDFEVCNKIFTLINKYKKEKGLDIGLNFDQYGIIFTGFILDPIPIKFCRSYTLSYLRDLTDFAYSMDIETLFDNFVDEFMNRAAKVLHDKNYKDWLSINVKKEKEKCIETLNS